jgi:hypothetical protein
MKVFITKSLVTALSLLMLISTVSVTVNQHLCMGEVVDIAFYAHAKSCGMEQDASNSGLALQADCCNTLSFSIEGQDNLNSEQANVDLLQLSPVAIPPLSPGTFVPAPNTAITAFQSHAPPLLHKDFQVLYATFLI